MPEARAQMREGKGREEKNPRLTLAGCLPLALLLGPATGSSPIKHSHVLIASLWLCNIASALLASPAVRQTTSSNLMFQYRNLELLVYIFEHAFTWGGAGKDFGLERQWIGIGFGYIRGFSLVYIHRASFMPPTGR